MSVREIVMWPDPRLSQLCEPVGVSEDLSELVADMFETMYAAPGRGLAGPQVGVMKRIFVMDVGWKDGEMTPLVCINPEILDSSDTLAVGTEGCLSIPGAPADVERPEAITLRWTGLDGQQVERRMTGAEARCAQHELDHLDGRVILDRIDADSRSWIEGAYLAAAG